MNKNVELKPWSVNGLTGNPVCPNCDVQIFQIELNIVLAKFQFCPFCGEKRLTRDCQEIIQFLEGDVC